jgi:hypothetical protein
MDGKQIIANLKKYFFETQLVNKQLKKKKNSDPVFV